MRADVILLIGVWCVIVVAICARIRSQNTLIHRLYDLVKKNTDDITDAQTRMDVARSHLDQLLAERSIAPAPLVAARNELNVTYLRPQTRHRQRIAR